jgi:hypothetical protein
VQISKNLADLPAASSDDVEFAYNLFLFRDPETTGVLNGWVGAPIRAMISEVIMSAEFSGGVLPGILRGVEPIFRGSKLLSDLKEWLLRVLQWDDDDRRAILSSVGPASLVLRTLRAPDMVIELIRDADSSALFDLAYYSKSRGLSFASLKDAVHDYLSRGAAAGANPNIVFETNWYRTSYVGDEAINPLVHFLLFENFHLASPFPLFDSKWYAKAFLSESASALNALVHYLSVSSA